MSAGGLMTSACEGSAGQQGSPSVSVGNRHSGAAVPAVPPYLG